MSGFVEVTSLTKVFPNGTKALDSLNLSVEQGEFFALLGPSGCGKTTLLRTIGGLEQATEGYISIDGKDVTFVEPGNRNIAMVFQDYALYPHMSVEENIGYPLKVRKVEKTLKAERIKTAADALQIQNLMERKPSQISGGQQQRVAVARAMATRPDLYLFDEPLSNLDARLRLEARTFLKQLQRELGVTTILVTHDQSEALALADRMAVMELGKIRQLGSPAEFFHRPANLFVAAFIGSTPMNLLRGKIQDGKVQIGSAQMTIPASAKSAVDGLEVVFGVRPEYLQVSSAQVGGFTGVVKVLENLGTHYLVSIDCEGTLVRGTVPDGEEPKPGTTISLLADPKRTLLYEAEGGELI
jgi:multiple sugar transport system ATP-binding protein